MQRRFIFVLLLAAFTAALFFSCTPISPYAKKGEIALYKGRFDEAVRFYQEAVRRDPTNPYYKSGLYRARMAAVVYYWNLAEKLLRQGKKQEALRYYRKALSYDPSNPRLLRQVRKLEGKEVRRREEAKPRPSVKVSLSFVNTNLKTIFKALGKYAGVNFMFDESFVDRPFSITLQNVDFERALRLLCASTKNFYFKIDDRNYLIVPDLPQKREQYQSQKIKVFYLRYINMKKLRSILPSMVRNEAVFTYDEDLKALVVRGSGEAISVVEKLLKKLDKPKPEVLIQVEVLEVDRSKLRHMGLDFSSFSIGAQLSPQEGSQGISLDNLFHLTSRDVLMLVPTAYLNFLETATESRIMAQPLIRGLDGEKVVFKVGERVPVPQTVFSPIAVGGVATQPITSFVYQDVGIIVEMKPEVNSSDEVTLDMKINVSSVTGTGYGDIPKFGNREIKMKLRVREGETVIIAGLLKNETHETFKSLPGFARIPVIGWLLSGLFREERQIDVVLALTPHIVSYPEVGEEDRQPIVLKGEAFATAREEGPVRPLESPLFRRGNRVSLLPLRVTRSSGEKFSVSVILRSSRPVNSGNVIISYDPSKLELVKVSRGAALLARKGELKTDLTSGAASLSFALPQGTRISAGQIAYIVFKLKSSGTSYVSIMSASFKDENGSPVSVEIGERCEVVGE